LRRFRDDPLLPAECVALIQEFIATLNRNLYAIYESSEEITQELKQSYRSPEEFDKASIHLAEGKVHAKFSSLKDPADRILAFIREYTHADSIFRTPEKKRGKH